MNDKKKTALIIMDLQKKFILSNTGMMNSTKLHIGTINDTATKFRNRKEPVVIIKMDCPIQPYMYGGPDCEDFFDDLIVDKNDVTVHKMYSNSFYYTDLEMILRDMECTDIVICGLSTQYCVMSTYYASYDLGFQPYLLKDGTITMDESVNDAAKVICRMVDCRDI